jgi:hypothetical protein
MSLDIRTSEIYKSLKDVSGRVVRFLSQFVDIHYITHGYNYSTVRSSEDSDICIFRITLLDLDNNIHMILTIDSEMGNTTEELEIIYKGLLSEFKEEIHIMQSLANSSESLLNRVNKQIIAETKKYSDRIVRNENKRMLLGLLSGR